MVNYNTTLQKTKKKPKKKTQQIRRDNQILTHNEQLITGTDMVSSVSDLDKTDFEITELFTESISMG